MEFGEGSTSSKRRRLKKVPDQIMIGFEESVENLSRQGKRTLGMLNRKRNKPISTLPDTVCAVFDRNCPRYNWLGPGWIAEERCKDEKRVYRYFYDPCGQTYDSKTEVKIMCEEMEKKQKQEMVNLDE